MTELPLIWAQTTTTYPVNGLPPDTPGSAVGAVMFFAVTAIIMGGALALFLRHRRPADEREPGTPSADT